MTRRRITPERKYRNIPTELDGFKFASKREAKRYQELKLLKVDGLSIQPEFPLKAEGQLICKYRGDFAYLENGRLVVEDVKGVKTPVYRLKKKLMKACLGIEIQEV